MQMDNNQGGSPDLSDPRQAVIYELEQLLHQVYADFEVPRKKVDAVLDRGRSLTEAADQGTADEQFAKQLEALAQKVFQAINLKKLKEEGLVKAVKL